jgi:hypothetical protein
VCGTLMADDIVVAAKDFSGMKESTLLSRTFQAQGIRLRLRKEPRASAYRNTSPANTKKRAFEEIDDDEEEELGGGAVQRPASLPRHRSTPQAAVEYAAVHAVSAIQQVAASAAGSYHAAAAPSSAHSTPPPMYSHSTQGFMVGGHSPLEYGGNTPSPSYLPATLDNSPMMPAYTTAPYATGFTSGGVSTPAYSTAPYSSVGYSAGGISTAGLSGGPYASPLSYPSVTYPPHPALSITADGAITDPQLSLAMPSTSMTSMPMFSADEGEHAWTTTAHSNVLGLS